MSNEREVSVCGVPFAMSIVDGGVLFFNRSGFYGLSERFMFSYRGGLWYLEERTQEFPGSHTLPPSATMLAHLIRMGRLLDEHVARDNEFFDNWHPRWRSESTPS